MSTILGFQTNHGKKAVVLAGDGCWMHYDERGKAYRAELGTKFIGLSPSEWMMLFSGYETPKFLAFKERMKNEKAARNFGKKFTADAMAGRPSSIKRLIDDAVAEQTVLGSYLVATLNPLAIWNVHVTGIAHSLYPLDNTKHPFHYYYDGTGEKEVKRAMSVQDFSRSRFTLEKAVEVAQNVLYLAQDRQVNQKGRQKLIQSANAPYETYTSGFQLAIVTEEGIKISPLYEHCDFGEFRTYCAAVVGMLKATMSVSAIP